MNEFYWNDKYISTFTTTCYSLSAIFHDFKHLNMHACDPTNQMSKHNLNIGCCVLI